MKARHDLRKFHDFSFSYVQRRRRSRIASQGFPGFIELRSLRRNSFVDREFVEAVIGFQSNLSEKIGMKTAFFGVVFFGSFICTSTAFADLFTYSANPGTWNTISAIPDPGPGVATGSLTADDTNMDGLISFSEVSAWSFTTSGFTDTRFNFSISNLGPNPIGGGSISATTGFGGSMYLANDSSIAGYPEVTLRANGSTGFQIFVPQAGGGIVGITSPNYSATVSAVPEPSNFAMLCLVGAVGFRRKRA